MFELPQPRPRTGADSEAIAAQAQHFPAVASSTVSRLEEAQAELWRFRRPSLSPRSETAAIRARSPATKAQLESLRSRAGSMKIRFDKMQSLEPDLASLPAALQDADSVEKCCSAKLRQTVCRLEDEATVLQKTILQLETELELSAAALSAAVAAAQSTSDAKGATSESEDWDGATSESEDGAKSQEKIRQLQVEVETLRTAAGDACSVAKDEAAGAKAARDELDSLRAANAMQCLNEGAKAFEERLVTGEQQMELLASKLKQAHGQLEEKLFEETLRRRAADARAEVLEKRFANSELCDAHETHATLRHDVITKSECREPFNDGSVCSPLTDSPMTSETCPSLLDSLTTEKQRRQMAEAQSTSLQQQISRLQRALRPLLDVQTGSIGDEQNLQLLEELLRIKEEELRPQGNGRKHLEAVRTSGLSSPRRSLCSPLLSTQCTMGTGSRFRRLGSPRRTLWAPEPEASQRPHREMSADEVFDRIDKNRDGSITRQDFVQAVHTGEFQVLPAPTAAVLYEGHGSRRSPRTVAGRSPHPVSRLASGHLQTPMVPSAPIATARSSSPLQTRGKQSPTGSLPRFGSGSGQVSPRSPLLDGSVMIAGGYVSPPPLFRPVPPGGLGACSLVPMITPLTATVWPSTARPRSPLVMRRSGAASVSGPPLLLEAPSLVSWLSPGQDCSRLPRLSAGTPIAACQMPTAGEPARALSNVRNAGEFTSTCGTQSPGPTPRPLAAGDSVTRSPGPLPGWEIAGPPVPPTACDSVVRRQASGTAVLRPADNRFGGVTSAPSLHEFMMRSEVSKDRASTRVASESSHHEISRDGAPPRQVTSHAAHPISRDGDLVRQGTDEVDPLMRRLSGAAAVPAVSLVAEDMYAQVTSSVLQPMSDMAAGLGIDCPQDDVSSQASQLDGGCASGRHLRALRADEDTVYFPSMESYEVVRNLPSR